MDFSPSLAEVMRSARPLIETAIAEDIGSGDVTSLATIPPDAFGKVNVLAKANGILAGMPVAEQVSSAVDPRIRFLARRRDGEPLHAGETIAVVEGPTRSLLAAERIALNFLQRLSGIASLTARYVEAVEGTRAVILDTRKTTPGYRLLEKYAVRMGGGKNHRIGLYDMVLIKDNHILAAGSLTAAVQKARAAQPNLPIEVEAATLAQVEEAMALPVDRILLDNMDVETIRRAVALGAGRIPFEVSGGVSLESVRVFAETGVQFISVGALTHSAPALDISWKLVGGRTPHTVTDRQE